MPVIIVSTTNASAFDVREFAKRVWAAKGFVAEGVNVIPLAEPDYEIRWDGDDYNSGGKPGGRHLEVRELGVDGKLGEWRRG